MVADVRLRMSTLTERRATYEAAVVRAEQEVDQIKAESQPAAPAAKKLAPSQLDQATVAEARGDLEISGRDSGVARHRLFYAVHNSLTMKTWEQKVEVVAEALQKILISPSSDMDVDFMRKCVSKVTAADARDHWNHLLTSIQTPGLLSWTAEGTVEALELSYSATLVLELNKFCQRCALPFVFVHQYPCASSSGKADVADLVVFRTDSKQRLMGLNEVKTVDRPSARWQLNVMV